MLAKAFAICRERRDILIFDQRLAGFSGLSASCATTLSANTYEIVRADDGWTPELNHHDWPALLLERETSWRRDKRLTARLRAAKLRHQASVEDVDYHAARGLDRALFQKLAGGDWIDAHDNLALVGPSRVGKSWLACAIGQKACRDNRSVLYHRWPRLCEELTLSRGDGRYPRLVKSRGETKSTATGAAPGRDHSVTGGRHYSGIQGRHYPVTDRRLHRTR